MLSLIATLKICALLIAVQIGLFVLRFIFNQSKRTSSSVFHSPLPFRPAAASALAVPYDLYDVRDGRASHAG